MSTSRVLLCSLMALLACTASARKEQCENVDAVIMGAGLGGLAAARKLQDAGKHVVVLESRKRIGGRLHSVHTGWKTAAGAPIVVDMGASWVEGTEGNPMTELAEQVGADLFPTPADGDTQYLVGLEGPDSGASEEEVALLEAGVEAVVAAIEEAFQSLNATGNDASLEELGDQLRAAVDDDGIKDDALQLAGIELGVGYVENEAGGDEPAISAGSYPLLNSFEGKGDWAIVPSGFDQTLGPLAQGLDVRLGDAVKSVKYGEGGVAVRTAKGKSYCGKRAVVAVPVGIMKQGTIKFEPQLPASQAEGWQAMGQGSFSKLFMRFAEPFWNTSAVWVIRAPTDVPALRKGWQSAGFEDDDAHRSWVQFVNLVPAYDGTPMLLAINNGRYARHLDGLSQEGVMQEGMKALRDMFADNTIPEPVAFKASNWTHDKHALGAYPYWASDVPLALDDTTQVAQRIFFAGDWVDGPVDIGYTHGAVLKGRAAADLLLGSL